MTGITGQLAFDLNALDDPLAELRARVAEPGMTPAEIDAVVRDALAQLNRPAPLAQPTPCLCDTSMLLVDALSIERRCAKCGRGAER